MAELTVESCKDRAIIEKAIQKVMVEQLCQASIVTLEDFGDEVLLLGDVYGDAMPEGYGKALKDVKWLADRIIEEMRKS